MGKTRVKSRKQDSAELIQQERRQLPPGLVGAVLVLVSVLLFAPALEGPWLLDDLWLIQTNDKVHSFSHAARWFTEGFWDVGGRAPSEVSLNYYRPLTEASYALDWTLGGGSTIPFHFTNLVLAALANMLAYVTFFRWFSGNLVLAFLATALFCFHPAKAESIAWISGRTDVLALIGCLLALFGFSLRLGARREKQSAGLGVALEVSGTAIAYLSKELAVVLPLLCLFEAYFLSQGEDTPAQDRKFHVSRLKLILPQASLALSYLFLRAWFYPLRPAGVPSLGFVEHGALLLSTLGHYAEILVVPRDLALKGILTADAQTDTAYIVLGGFVLGATLLLLGSSRRKWPGLAYALLLFCGLLAPVSNLVPMGTSIQLSPRFLYMPSLAWSVVVVLLGKRASLWLSPHVGAIAQKYKLRVSGHRIGFGVALLVVTFFGAMSVSRASDFSSEQRFWSYELASQPSEPSVILSKALAEAEVGEVRLAERRLACGYARSVESRDPLAVTKYLEAAIEIPYQRTPDRDQARLARLGKELDAILHLVPEQKAQVGELSFGGTVLELVAISQIHTELLFRKAEVLSRQNLPIASDVAEFALGHCFRCAKEVRRAALVALRVGDDARAEKWAMSLGNGIAASEFQHKLRRVQELTRSSQAEPRRARHALLERDLILGNDEQVVRQLLASPDLRKGASTERLVAYAEAAYTAGYPELAEKWLKPLGEETSRALRDEIRKRTTWRQDTDSGAAPSFVAGTCALPRETTKTPRQTAAEL